MNTALKERRLSFSKTQAQLAEEAGISLRAYQNFEYGDRIPRTDVGNRLAQILHASPMELWGCGKEA